MTRLLFKHVHIVKITDLSDPFLNQLKIDYTLINESDLFRLMLNADGTEFLRPFSFARCFESVRDK